MNTHTDFPKWEVGMELPKEGVQFVYIGPGPANGEVFTWQKCQCKNPTCQRAMVYDTDGNEDMAMTIRARGDNTGFAVVKVLTLATGQTFSAIADKIDEGTSLARQFWQIAGPLKTESKLENFLLAHGISPVLMAAAADEAIIEQLEEIGEDLPPEVLQAIAGATFTILGPN